MDVLSEEEMVKSERMRMRMRVSEDTPLLFC